MEEETKVQRQKFSCLDVTEAACSAPDLPPSVCTLSSWQNEKMLLESPKIWRGFRSPHWSTVHAWAHVYTLGAQQLTVSCRKGELGEEAERRGQAWVEGTEEEGHRQSQPCSAYGWYRPGCQGVRQEAGLGT